VNVRKCVWTYLANTDLPDPGFPEMRSIFESGEEVQSRNLRWDQIHSHVLEFASTILSRRLLYSGKFNDPTHSA
jgi:hypothetical protein